MPGTGQSNLQSTCSLWQPASQAREEKSSKRMWRGKQKNPAGRKTGGASQAKEHNDLDSLIAAQITPGEQRSVATCKY